MEIPTRHPKVPEQSCFCDDYGRCWNCAEYVQEEYIKDLELRHKKLLFVASWERHAHEECHLHETGYCHQLSTLETFLKGSFYDGLTKEQQEFVDKILEKAESDRERYDDLIEKEYNKMRRLEKKLEKLKRK